MGRPHGSIRNEFEATDFPSPFHNKHDAPNKSLKQNPESNADTAWHIAVSLEQDFRLQVLFLDNRNSEVKAKCDFRE